MVTRRSKQDMPKQGHIVIISSTNSAYDGMAGYVTEYSGGQKPGRPYEVKFNDGNVRRFRRGEVWFAN